jgi:hypothetical protein
MSTTKNAGLSQAVSYSVYLTQKRRTFSSLARKIPFPRFSKEGVPEGNRKNFLFVPASKGPDMVVDRLRPAATGCRGAITLAFCPLFRCGLAQQSIHSRRKVNKFVVEKSSEWKVIPSCFQDLTEVNPAPTAL